MSSLLSAQVLSPRISNLAVFVLCDFVCPKETQSRGRRQIYLPRPTFVDTTFSLSVIGVVVRFFSPMQCWLLRVIWVVSPRFFSPLCRSPCRSLFPTD
ncbi:hypothetical protein M413DRAFT_346061 [Hebeloma cylindrosporum]|uniref:Uncharacterized protein n=1 Tax=Hebeloma cylindrosporum TaxID=76867 RepID=A0A0C3CPI1_HEBCY|nr:hypothetical protein M413DRAFT_346061 [Hebeloma cylindrosporum h7]